MFTDTELIIAVREDHQLHYIDLESLTERVYNMNALGDDHVSFSALDLALSADKQHVLVATDKSRLILFQRGSPIQVRNYYGMASNRLGQCRVAWNHSDAYIYAVCIPPIDSIHANLQTSDDNKIYVFDATTEEVVHTLEGHKNTIVSHPLMFHNSNKARFCNPQDKRVDRDGFVRQVRSDLAVTFFERSKVARNLVR